MTKFLLLLFLALFSVCYSETILLDNYAYNFTFNNPEPATFKQLIFNNSGILGGQKDVYIYQYPLSPYSDATLLSGIAVQSSASNARSNFGKLSFNVDANIFGYSIQVYDGVDNQTGHPCGDFTLHLDNSACNTPQPNVAQPGLQLDLSGKEGVGFEMLSLDHGAGTSIILRFWDNNGGSSYFTVLYPNPITLNSLKPIIYVPFTSFSNPSLNWSNIRAFAVEFNSTVESVDAIVGPFQFMSYTAQKQYVNNGTVIAPNTAAPFQIKILPDPFFSFDSTRDASLIQIQVNITDILPSPFLSISNLSLSAHDQNGTNIPVEILSDEGRLVRMRLTFNPNQITTISYSALSNPSFDFCSNSFCNNVTLTSLTSVPLSSLNLTSTKTLSLSTCFEMRGQPTISTSYISSPSASFTNSSGLLQYSVSVCNNGNSLATNPLFVHTASEALGRCTPNFSQLVNEINCFNGTTCSSLLQNIPANSCYNLSFSYDCSSLLSSCLVSSLSSSFSVNENCANSSSTSMVSFNTNPELRINVSEVLLRNVTYRVKDVISWNITASNLGPSSLPSFSLHILLPNFTAPTNETKERWQCTERVGEERWECVLVYNSSVLPSGSSPSNPFPFSLSLLDSVILGTTEICNEVTMRALPNEPNCFSEARTVSCAVVDPGIPDVDLQKGVFTSQYSFTIDYENAGTGAINNLELNEILQVGWSFNSNLSTPGWSCGESLCTFSLPSLAPSASGSVLFVVNVDQSSQVNLNGESKCWENIVSSTFTDEDYDPTPNNNQASAKIGSSCKSCCETAPCPTSTCQLTCPPPNITVPCPQVECKCEIPDYYCPPCQINPPSCSCAQCSNSP